MGVVRLLQMPGCGPLSHNLRMAVPGPPQDTYSSLEPVQHLDKMLDLDQALRGIPSGDPAQLTDMQAVALEPIPAASSVAASIRVMIREGYLVSAMILFRPLVERVATRCYLELSEVSRGLWQQGWPHRARPSLKTRLGAMVPGASPDLVNRLWQAVAAYHALVHGDPVAAKQSLTYIYDGPEIRIGYALGRDYRAPGRAASIAAETGLVVAFLTARTGVIFRQS
jgi:hypothetical protein